MRKRTFAKWAALGACVVFVLCFAGAITINYPFYPAFKKEVNSFDNLQKILRNTPGVFLPDVSSEEFDGWKYALKLDDRNTAYTLDRLTDLELFIALITRRSKEEIEVMYADYPCVLQKCEAIRTLLESLE